MAIYSEVCLGNFEKLAAFENRIIFSSDGTIYQLGVSEPLLIVSGNVTEMLVNSKGKLVVLAVGQDTKLYFYDLYTSSTEIIRTNFYKGLVTLDEMRRDRVISAYWPSNPKPVGPYGWNLSLQQKLALECGNSFRAIYVSNNIVDVFCQSTDTISGHVYVYANDDYALAIGANLVTGKFCHAVFGAFDGLFLFKEKNGMYFHKKDKPVDVTPIGLGKDETISSACEAQGFIYVATSRRLLVFRFSKV